MPSPYENNLYERGRYGGDIPNNFDTDKGREAYNSGREQRDIDRSTNEALDKLINGNNKPY